MHPQQQTHRSSQSWQRSAWLPARTLTRANSMQILSNAFRKSPLTASCFSSRSANLSRISTAGCSIPKPAFMEWITSIAPSSPPSGLGANRVQDAVYPTSLKDAEGKAYDGANKYVVHFPKGQLPPVRGFWSITMYDANYFFVANPINRYSISARQNLKANPDGSIDLYIQNQSPGADKESNWLPAPKDKFILMLRMYWPSEKSPSIINGTWKPPAVKKVT